MRARRNSPALDASRIPRMPPPPRQAEMGGMETDAASVLLTSMQRSKEGKTSRNKQAEDTFDFHCRSYALPPFVRQWKLLKTEQTPRKDGKDIPNAWRFDFCFPDFQVIVEVDGGIFMPGGGAHSHPVDVKRNLAKRNDAALAGFVVLGFMPEQIKRGEAIAFAQRVLYARGWQR